MTRAVLFDLDGTFADTAPDLGHAINLMRTARGLEPVPLSATRPVTSMGARGLLGVGFGIAPGEPGYDDMRSEFLELYETNICVHTRLFSGMAELVDAIESRSLRWGIVTNKAEYLAKPLLAQLGYSDRAACIIGGDTTGKLKPDPAPLLAAARTIAIAPEACVYVGDDLRDIQAGKAAGMRTVAVRYGYLNGSDPGAWGADAVVDHPADILQVL